MRDSAQVAIRPPLSPIRHLAAVSTASPVRSAAWHYLDGLLVQLLRDNDVAVVRRPDAKGNGGLPAAAPRRRVGVPARCRARSKVVTDREE